MGILDRLFRVSKGKLNQGVDKLEDATFESTLRQSIRDMEDQLHRVIRSAADAMSNCNRLEAEYGKFLEQSKDWEGKARKALLAGNEDLARKALAKKTECEQQAATLKDAVDQGVAARDKLKNQVEQLRRKIDESKRKASTLIARKNAANAQKKMAQVMSGLGTDDNAFASIARFEEAVNREEATAKAYENMSAGADPDLEKEFAALDVSTTDSELDRLRAEVKASKAP